jgi:hypothetical protein
MPRSRVGHRVYFLLVGLFAIWVGLWGYGFPTEIDRALPWSVPPLHARFLGAMYLSGATLMIGALASRRPAEIGIATWMATIWTGMLGIVSFLNLSEFDFTRPPVWFWFFAYVAYPAAGAWLALTGSSPAVPAPIGNVPGRVRGWLALQGAILVALACVLFFRPSAAATFWPWPIPVLLAQIYAGPFMSYGVGSLLLSRQRDWADCRMPLASMLVFALLVLVASTIHLPVFGEIGVAATIWFAGFVVLALMLSWLTLNAIAAPREPAGSKR